MSKRDLLISDIYLQLKLLLLKLVLPSFLCLDHFYSLFYRILPAFENDVIVCSVNRTENGIS